MTAETLPENAAAEPRRAPRLLLTAVVAALVLALDLWSKAWAWDHLRRTLKVVLVEGFLELDFAFNTGSAFGFLRSASWSRIFFIVITIAAVIYMVRLALTLPTRFISGYMAVAMIIGGALGNLHDRFFRILGGKHGVVDFLIFYYWPGKRWPAFNVADVALVAGVILFMIFLRRHGAALDGAGARR